jgi:replicative DNA helicase
MSKVHTVRQWAAGEPLQPLPHNLDAEQALLGAILVNNEAFERVAGFLLPEHFCEGVHHRIFEAASDLIRSGRRADPVTLKNHFDQDGALAEIGGPAYLARLAAAATTIINTEEYGRLVYELAMRRRGIAACEAAVNDLIGVDIGEFNSALARTIGNLTQIADGSEVHRAQTAGETATAIVERIAEVHRGGVAAIDMAYPGSERLAWAIGGWRRGRLYILGGRPGMGKTSCISFFIRTAGRGHGVLLFSLEMDAKEVTERLLSDMSWTRDRKIPYVDIGRDLVSEEDLQRLAAAKDRLSRLPIIIDDRPSLTLAQIRASARLAARQMATRGKRLDIVVIDHIGLVKPSDRYRGNKVAETEEASAAMKALAKELDCAVVCMVQLNRATEGREDKRPTLADLRWSGALEQDADAVLLLYRAAYYLERPFEGNDAERAERAAQLYRVRTLLEIHIAKQRGGGTPSLRFFTDIACSVIRDMELYR